MPGLRFCDYRGITARYDSDGGCGHPIKQGDHIGYARKGRKSNTRCADCWQVWTAENAEADMLESSGCYPC